MIESDITNQVKGTKKSVFKAFLLACCLQTRIFDHGAKKVHNIPEQFTALGKQ